MFIFRAFGSLNLILWAYFWFYCLIFYKPDKLCLFHWHKPETMSPGTAWNLPVPRVQWHALTEPWTKPRMPAGIAYNFIFCQVIWCLYTVGVTNSRCPNWRSRTIFFGSKWVGDLFDPRCLWTLRCKLRVPVIWNEVAGTDRLRAQQGRERRSKEPSKKKLKIDLVILMACFVAFPLQARFRLADMKLKHSLLWT